MQPVSQMLLFPNRLRNLTLLPYKSPTVFLGTACTKVVLQVAPTVMVWPQPCYSSFYFYSSWAIRPILSKLALMVGVGIGCASSFNIFIPNCEEDSRILG